MEISVMYWSESALFPLLTLMTMVPLAATFAVLLVNSKRLITGLGYLGALITGLLALYLLSVFDQDNSGIQLAERLAVAGMSYNVGVDGANLLFILMTTVLTLLALIYVQGSRFAGDGSVIAALLGYEAILIGAFAALNALQFWLWSVMEVIPVAFLTVYAGTGSQRKHALKILLQFWGGGLLLTFVGIMLLGFGLEDSEQPVNFDWLALAQNNAPFANETLIFILLIFGFAVRMPLFPFHAWLPLLAEQGAVAGVGVFVVGLKLGIYAVIRFILPLIPGVADEWSSLVVTMGLIGIFYGALLALMQINIRRLLAFAVISHTGMLIIGVFSFELDGVEGSLLLSLAYGLAAAGMLLSIGFIYEHTNTAYMPRLGHVWDTRTALGILFLISALSTMAMPGTPGFDAAHMLISGVVGKNGWIIATVIGLGNVLAAAFLLWAFQRVFLADIKRAVTVNHLVKSPVYERIIALLICGLLLTTGFYSSPWLSLVNTANGTIGKYYNLHNSIYEEYEQNNAPVPAEEQEFVPEELAPEEPPLPQELSPKASKSRLPVVIDEERGGT